MQHLSHSKGKRQLAPAAAASGMRLARPRLCRAWAAAAAGGVGGCRGLLLPLLRLACTAAAVQAAVEGPTLSKLWGLPGVGQQDSSRQGSSTPSIMQHCKKQSAAVRPRPPGNPQRHRHAQLPAWQDDHSTTISPCASHDATVRHCMTGRIVCCGDPVPGVHFSEQRYVHRRTQRQP